MSCVEMRIQADVVLHKLGDDLLRCQLGASQEVIDPRCARRHTFDDGERGLPHSEDHDEAGLEVPMAFEDDETAGL